MAALTAILTNTEDTGRLKAELQSLRRKGALKASADFDSTGPDPERSCGRCRVELGRVINRGAYCRACRLKVCKGCREYSFRTTDWVCTVCHKHMEIQAASGEWMNEFVRRPSRRRDNRVYVPAADIIKRTIRRSWTISNPTPRWNAIRGSPEIRPYNSLPRGQDISNYPSLIQHQINKDNKEEIPSPTAKISPILPRKHSPARRSHSEDVYSDIRTQTDQSSIKTDQSPIKASIKTDQSSIKIDQSSIKTDQSSIKTEQSPIKTDQASIKTDQSQTPPPSSDSETKSAKESPPVRVNPLIKFAAERRQSSLGSEVPKAKKKLQSTKAFSEPSNTAKFEKDVKSIEDIIQERKHHSGTPEKRVSFDDERISKDSDGESRQGMLSKKFETSTPNEKTNNESVEATSCPSGEAGQNDGDGQVVKEEGPAIELCDIEPLSGTVFRKVTVRRRRQDYRKISASENGWRTRTDGGDLIDILLPEGDDYKLVFISSSDSSSKEEDVDDNDSSSASTSSSFPFDDCDWDYFEPGTATTTRSNSRMLNWNSPFGSPGVYRRSALESPIGSPLVYRRARFDIDDENTRIDSPASSDGFSYLNRNVNEENAMEDVSLQCAHQTQPDDLQKPCQSCGAPTQYVPIPVPVPIPIPMLWTADSLVLYNNNTAESLEHNLKSRLRRSILPLLNQAAFIWPLINDTDANNLFLSALQSEAASRLNGSAATTAELNVSKLPANHTKSTAATAQSSPARDEAQIETNSGENVIMNVEGKEEMTVKTDDCVPYLLSDFKYVSSSSSSSESDGEAKPRVKRTYNVTGGDTSTSSDDALPSSEVSDDDENQIRSSRGDDDSSELEEDSDSDSVDTDDTGTVADKKSTKKFSCVYVVNKRRSSEESRSDSDKTDGEESGIILTHIKHFSDSRELLNGNYSDDSLNRKNRSGGSDDSEASDAITRNKRNKSAKTGPNSDDSDSDSSDHRGKISNFKNKRNKSYKNVKITKLKERCSAKAGGRSDGSDSSDQEMMQLLFEEIDSAQANTKIQEDNSSDNPKIIEGNSSDSDDDLNLGDCTVIAKEIGDKIAPTIITDENRDVPTITIEENCELKPEDGDNDDETNHDNTTKNRDELNDENSDCSDAEMISIENLEQISHFDVCKIVNSDTISLPDEVPIIKIENGDKIVEIHPEQEPQHNHNKNRVKDSLKEYMSSPGLSDVSAESLSSSSSSSSFSDTEQSCPLDLTSGELQLSDSVERGEWAGGTSESDGAATGVCLQRNAARYTSLVMITQENNTAAVVSVVTSDTTMLVPDGSANTRDEIIVRHTNWQDENGEKDHYFINKDATEKDLEANSDVTVITGGDTLSAVVCLEEGLADDDSWVENLSHNEDDFVGSTDDTSSGEEVTLTCSDQEDELRGYHRAAIDFTLHTIVEESCEESEVEQFQKKPRPKSATDLEKYFFYGLGDGTIPSMGSSNREDAFSETSSICSESMDSIGGCDKTPPNEAADPAELASSRLENYFLTGFMGFTASRRDSDGSVGSDSEGKPSPEQRRKRLVRARGTGRSHSSSLDNLLANPDLSGAEQQSENQCSEDSSSDSDTYDESNSFEKSDGQFDTVKRKKNKKKNIGTNSPDESKISDHVIEDDQIKSEKKDDDNNGDNDSKKQQRDSGFIGSSDDLIKDQKDLNNSDNVQNKFERVQKIEEKIISGPPMTNLTRKDSFNNWSSDEETNLMMCKMRQFFKTMVAANNQSNPSSKPSTPIMGMNSPKIFASPKLKNKTKPPQLVYFENELTRLMKTVPGIRDDQVREIVEYLSSEDTWSDSYDSSDYTSSDLEGTSCTKTALQQQISDSCQQIINKFDKSVEDEEGDEGDGGIIDETSQGLNKETAFVYQKLVASFEKMATGDNPEKKIINPHNSPPLIAKVMHHIGKRLVALMHEVSSGESHCSNSPKTKHYHRRLQQKLYSTSSTTTEDDDSTSDSNLPDKLSNLDEVTCYNLLPRSRSHDLLVSENRNLHQSSSGVSDIAEEREVSDCERFSWRGSFESALLATDSRNKLSAIGGEGSASASALAIAAKRRSAGDLLFAHKSLSREQLDRVRSCGSIGGGNSEDKLWVTHSTRPSKRRSSVPDTTCGGSGDSADGEDDDEDCEEDDDDQDEELENRSTLPRSLQSGPATTNSLPRLPTTNATAAQNTTNMHKTQSMYHFLQQNVKSARYRPPGFNRLTTTVPKRAVSAPGLQPTHQRRSRHKQQSSLVNDDVSQMSEAHSSPMLAARSGTKSATPSPIAPNSRRTTGSVSSQEWRSNDEDIDRLVVPNRSSVSSLGLRSDSMASVYSGAFGGECTVAVKGQVEFGLQYNYKTGALEILIKQCRDLAAVDAKRNRSDPYVKVYLLPDKSKSGKRKTKVKKHTLNPIFDECLKFHIALNGLETRTLWLTVWHSDMFGRNDFLGEVTMALENKVFDDPTPKWYTLQERTEPFDDMLSFKGDILVGLKFVPPDMTDRHKKGKRSRGSLHVLIKEAKSLTAVKANGTSDPFCKSYLLPDKGRSSKQKTTVMKKTVNPVWNHTFTYEDVTLQELAERCLELTVWDHDRLASNEFLGGVRFSLGTGKHYGKPVDWMDATGKEVSLWKSMLERPSLWVEGCLSLRPTLDQRSTQ